MSGANIDPDRDLWIVVQGWDDFQHYKDRRPAWIKTYTDLLRRDEYVNLTGHLRAILHGLWLEYASTDCRLRLDTLSLTRRLHLRVSKENLKSLYEAGFITFAASPPLAQRKPRARPETEREVEKESSTPKPPPPSRNGPRPPTDFPCPDPTCHTINLRTEQQLRDHYRSIHFLEPDEIDRAIATWKQEATV